MSIKIMTVVWATALPSTDKLVLLALADNANDEGHCWPAVQTLADKCGIEPRSVTRVFERLESNGHLTRHERPGRSNTYTVHPRPEVTPDLKSPLTKGHPTPDPPVTPPLTHSQGTPDPRSPITIIEPSSEPSRNQKTVAKARDDGPVDRVFDHWRSEYRHPKATLDPKRRRAIQRALEAYDEPSLCTAISGYKLSPHHMGQNDQRTVYDDISLFLRDAEHVERGMNFARAPPVRAMSAVEIAQQNLRRPLGATNGSVVAEQDGGGESHLVAIGGVLR